MCGLVGIAGDLAFKDEMTMKRLLLLDFWRGPDSTGLASIRNNGDVKLSKIAGNPLELFDMQRFKDALSGSNSTAFIGHNRAATRGVVSTYNAHPYQFDHIVGAHNGTLDYHAVQDLEKAIGERFPVDSMAIFAGIAKLGLNETISMLQGAWALTWVDLKQNTLNFLRNKERPLFFAHDKDFKRVFWASQWEFIAHATKESGQYELFTDKEGYSFFTCEENVHYCFDLEQLRKGGSERPKAKARKIEGKAPAPVAPISQNNGPRPFTRRETPQNTGGGGSNTPTNGATQMTTMGSSPSDNPVARRRTVIEVEGDENNPLAGFILRPKFDIIAKDGCKYCECPVNWGDPGIVIYEKDDILLCADCGSGGSKLAPSRIHILDLDKLV